MDKKFFLTNSRTGRREEFKTLTPGKVLFYSCGPTVYGPLHIGNGRALIFADLIFRWLRYLGYEVNFVRNYTDVDDKIIARANEEKIPAGEVAQKYIDYCETDIRLLGLKPPTKVVRVTESMPQIIELIQKIIDRGHGYVVDGEVFFSIDSFPSYGKLSGKKVEDLQAGARVDVDSRKKSPLDFSLWKPHKPGEPYWDSPWSKGRPGWHIECSSMAKRWLGDTIDLHHGGQDLIFPHHENEIAQSEAANGKTFCNHWVHHAFFTAGNEKMSKSLGNILPIREFIERYSGELLKFICLSFHYRSSIPYTEATLSQAIGELERVYLAKKWAVEAGQTAGVAVADAAPPTAPSDAASGGIWTELSGKAFDVEKKIDDEMLADLNTSGALGHLFAFIRDLNRAEAGAAGKPGLSAPATAERALIAREFLRLIEKLETVWGVFGEAPSAMLNRIEAIRRQRVAQTAGDGGLSDDAIRALIEERNAARKARDFKRADDIRKELDQKGIQLVDSPQGTAWKAKA